MKALGWGRKPCEGDGLPRAVPLSSSSESDKSALGPIAVCDRCRPTLPIPCLAPMFSLDEVIKRSSSLSVSSYSS